MKFKIAALKFEFGCGFYFCVIGALKYIIGKTDYLKSGVITYFRYKGLGRIVP